MHAPVASSEMLISIPTDNIETTVKSNTEPNVEINDIKLKRENRIKTLLLILAIAMIGALIGIFSYLTASGILLRIINWMQTIGYWSYLIIISLMIFIHLPFGYGYSFLLIGCGFSFGFIQAYIPIQLGNIVGIPIGIYISRKFARNYVNSIMRTKSKKVKGIFDSIDGDVENNGWKFTLLIRASPLSIGITNGFLGATKISFKNIYVVSVLYLLVEGAVNVYVGTLAKNLADVFSGSLSLSPIQTALLVVQIVLLIALLFGLGFVIRKAVKRISSQSKKPSLQNSKNIENKLETEPTKEEIELRVETVPQIVEK